MCPTFAKAGVSRCSWGAWRQLNLQTVSTEMLGHGLNLFVRRNPKPLKAIRAIEALYLAVANLVIRQKVEVHLAA